MNNSLNTRAPRGLVAPARGNATQRVGGALAAILALIAGALMPLPPALAHEYKVGAIEIEHPWSRATPPGATTGAGYLGLSNEGASDDRLVGASSPAAATTEIHEMSVVDGVMRMKPVEGGLVVPAGGEVTLAPGGYHVMLMGLVRPLAVGERVPLTLRFEKAGSVDVELQVDAMGAKAPVHGHDGAHTDAPAQ